MWPSACFDGFWSAAFRPIELKLGHSFSCAHQEHSNSANWAQEKQLRPFPDPTQWPSPSSSSLSACHWRARHRQARAQTLTSDLCGRPAHSSATQRAAARDHRPLGRPWRLATVSATWHCLGDLELSRRVVAQWPHVRVVGEKGAKKGQKSCEGEAVRA